MDSESQDFKDLRRLLVLKRHEQPPPGYFSRLSRDVIVRLEAGDGERESFVQRLAEEAPWLGRLVDLFVREPLWTGGAAAAACALGIVGVAAIQNLVSKPVQTADAAQPVLSLTADQPSFVFNQAQAASLTNISDQSNLPASLFIGPGINPQRANLPGGMLLQH
jgi:hypothetical protein